MMTNDGNAILREVRTHLLLLHRMVDTCLTLCVMLLRFTGVSIPLLSQ